MSPKVLLVEDHAVVRESVRDYLRAKGCEVLESDTWRRAHELLQAHSPDAAVVDYLLPDGNALDNLPRLRGADPRLPVIVLTGNGSIDLAVRAIKEGADHFLTKPIELATLWIVLQRTLDTARIRRKDAAEQARGRNHLDPFAGGSDAMRRLEEQARIIAGAQSPVLIQGETGAGKGVLAKWIHEQSPRRKEPFIDLNCAGLSRDLLESELFGHERGAFTGAISAKQGLFEAAHRGTIFLDEIGDVDIQVQPKLLKVLEEKRFRRLGDVRDRAVDVRLIAATHQDLASALRERRFREDLYFRISTIPLVVPPLRERPEEIPILARRFVAHFGAELGRAEINLDSRAENALRAHSWPGNIRELRNVIERAVLLARSATITTADLRFEAPARAENALPDFGDLTLDELERLAILRALERDRGRVERAAARLGIARTSLYHRIKKYDIDLSRF